MAQTSLDPQQLRTLLRETLAEALRDERDLLREVFQEVIEDVGLAEAVREGRDTDPVSRDDVFRLLDGDSS